MKVHVLVLHNPRNEFHDVYVFPDTINGCTDMARMEQWATAHDFKAQSFERHIPKASAIATIA